MVHQKEILMAHHLVTVLESPKDHLTAQLMARHLATTMARQMETMTADQKGLLMAHRLGSATDL